MKLAINPESSTPVFQQIVEQVHFSISAGELTPGNRLPSIRKVAADLSIAPNTVAKAYRQLEFRGLVTSVERSGFEVASAKSQSRYQARGVSADKTEVHQVVDQQEQGLFPNAFCKITEDYLSGDPAKCNVIHADGAGTKSIVAYLWYKETGDAEVFRGIAQDSIVMNLDDLLCVGVDGRILISNTVNRNALNCPGEVIASLIEGTEAFLQQMRDQGVMIYSGGGETADVGDMTGTIVVDSCAVAIMEKNRVVTNTIGADLAIVGLSSTGRASFESVENSGMGSNGLTSARHELLCHDYADLYPETFDANVDPDLIYCGPYHLQDPLSGSSLSIGEAILSPTRSYAPLVYRIRAELDDQLKGLVHCSGGAQTKCLRFGDNVHFVKDHLFETPPLFEAIRQASGTSWEEMYKVFNMGHRMEVYVPHQLAEVVIDIARSFDVAAQVIGRTEAATHNQLSLLAADGNTYQY